MKVRIALLMTLVVFFQFMLVLLILTDAQTDLNFFSFHSSSSLYNKQILGFLYFMFIYNKTVWLLLIGQQSPGIYYDKPGFLDPVTNQETATNQWLVWVLPAVVYCKGNSDAADVEAFRMIKLDGQSTQES